MNIPSTSTAATSISASAAKLLSFFRTEEVRWVVLSHAWTGHAADLDDQEFVRALEELEAAELVERAPYGPLLYIR